MKGDRGPDGRPELEAFVDRARNELRDWTDTSGGDPGVALLELFAYVGDLISSYSDRLAAEGYLGERPDRSPSRHGEDVDIEIGGQRWQRVADFAGSSADDTHYVVSRSEGGGSVVEFGDGVHGRRPPSGDVTGIRFRTTRSYSSVLLQQGRVVIDHDDNEEPPRSLCGIYRAAVLDNEDPLARRRLRVRVPDAGADDAGWAEACLSATGSDHVPAVDSEIWVTFEAGDTSRPVWLGQRVLG